MTSVSTQTPLGDPKNGGALFTIPRELRDEIYRLLLKRSCAVSTSKMIIPWDGRCANDVEYDKPSLVILRVSQAVSREAQDLFYSESEFRITVDVNMHLYELKPLSQALSRARNIQIMIPTISSDECVHKHWQSTEAIHDPVDFKYHMETICQATIDRFTVAQTRRDSCRIYLTGFGSRNFFPITDYILPRLAALKGFNTIVMGVLMESHWAHEPENDDDDHDWWKTSRDLRRFKPKMRHILEPTLGPARGGSCQIGFRLDFKPREHMTSVLNAEGTEAVVEG